MQEALVQKKVPAGFNHELYAGLLQMPMPPAHAPVRGAQKPPGCPDSSGGGGGGGGDGVGGEGGGGKGRCPDTRLAPYPKVAIL